MYYATTCVICLAEWLDMQQSVYLFILMKTIPFTIWVYVNISKLENIENTIR